MTAFIYIPFAASGDRASIPETPPGGGGMNWTEGYGPDYGLAPTDPSALNIERNKFNQLIYQICVALNVFWSHGAPDWIPSADNGGVAFQYDVNSVVRYGGLLYVSLVPANTDLPTVTASWRKIVFGFNPMPTTVETTAGPINMTANQAYVANNGSGSVAFNTPAGAAFGDENVVVDESGHGFTITAGMGQTIKYLGVSGTVLTSIDPGASVIMKCTATNTEFRVYGGAGRVDLS